MSDWNQPQGPFDIPDVPGFVPRRLKPWMFILFVLIIQFSGGLYLAAVTDMVGTTALMQEDILMAGYASLIGMSLNFAVMFRIKFRFSNRTQLLATGIVLLAATIVCSVTTNVAVLTLACFIAGWFRMQGTLACNSTIQLWITPARDMAVFFCYVYLLVDGVIQLSGLTAVYTALYSQWEYMHYLMAALLCLMMLLVLWLVRPVRNPMYIPLRGIDWLGSALWGIFFLCFTFVSVYGNFFDWWESSEIWCATLIGVSALMINLWRATFMEQPYISFASMTNRNVIRAVVIYLIFFTLMACEHLFEHTYASAILGFDETNLIDLNWYVLCGIVAGAAFTYFTFALHRWSYKTMTAIAFTMAAAYLLWFYFHVGCRIEKEALFAPLFLRGAASVIISICYLTSIVRSGLPFTVFPQALVINGFVGAVMGVSFCPAILAEWFEHVMARNSATLGFTLTHTNPDAVYLILNQLYGAVQTQALIVSMKEIIGWLLILALISLLIILFSYESVRQLAIHFRTKLRIISANICSRLV
ncbi:MAG: hypothetical protein K2O00_01355 [Muribaculaceae bacterium]|nr:hypothetical protein [Muribaculaceae bacterium]